MALALIDDTDDDVALFESMLRLTKDLREAARLLSPQQQRILVDMYYQLQESRKRLANQLRAAQQEPNAWTTLMTTHLRRLEKLAAGALDIASNQQAVSRWSKSIYGIGPVLTAGLAAYIDITRTPSPSALWRLAGQDSTRPWQGREHITDLLRTAREVEPSDWRALIWVCRALAARPGAVLLLIGAIDQTLTVPAARQLFQAAGGDLATVQMVEREGDNVLLGGNLPDDAVAACFQQAYPTVTFTTDVWATLIKTFAKRPWNAKLKVLCYLIGESFMKFHNSPKCFYGHLYAQRKLLEVERSEAGQFAVQAAQTLRDKRITDKETRAVYDAGKLPAGRLELRARRVAVKRFLSDYWSVAYYEHFQRLPPPPYIIAKDPLLHTQYVAPAGYEAVFVWPIATNGSHP